MISLEQALAAVPQAAKLRVASFLPYLNSAMTEFGIDTPLRQAAFLAQVFHESGYLAKVEENLNYGAAGLHATWPSRFDAATAAKYERKPEMIANRVYADRMGNRDEASGDGWKHRGAGLIQLTGKDNQFACAMALNVDPTTIADWLKTEQGAARSAGWFWAKQIDGNKYADGTDAGFVALTKKINGGVIGLDERRKLYAAFRSVLGV